MSKRLTDREKLLFKLDHLSDSEVEEVLEYVSIMETMKRERRQPEMSEPVDDDLLAILSGARENLRARQVHEWEAVRRSAEAGAAGYSYGRR
jgi:hypothetical protein